jgi:hypothetical protein
LFIAVVASARAVTALGAACEFEAEGVCDAFEELE